MNLKLIFNKLWSPFYGGLYTELTNQLDGDTYLIQQQLDDQVRNPVYNILCRNVCMPLERQMRNERTLMNLNIVFGDMENKLMKELSIQSAINFINVSGEDLYTGFYFRLGNQTTNQLYARLNQQIRDQLK